MSPTGFKGGGENLRSHSRPARKPHLHLHLLSNSPTLRCELICRSLHKTTSTQRVDVRVTLGSTFGSLFPELVGNVAWVASPNHRVGAVRSVSRERSASDIGPSRTPGVRREVTRQPFCQQQAMSAPSARTGRGGLVRLGFYGEALKRVGCQECDVDKFMTHVQVQPRRSCRKLDGPVVSVHPDSH